MGSTFLGKCTLYGCQSLNLLVGNNYLNLSTVLGNEKWNSALIGLGK